MADQAIDIQRLSSASEEKGNKILRVEGRVKTLETQNEALYESMGEMWTVTSMLATTLPTS